MSIAKAYIRVDQKTTTEWITRYTNGYDHEHVLRTKSKPRIARIDEAFHMRKCPTHITSFPGDSDVRLKGVNFKDGVLRYAGKTFVNLIEVNALQAPPSTIVQCAASVWTVGCEVASQTDNVASHEMDVHIEPITYEEALGRLRTRPTFSTYDFAQLGRAAYESMIAELIKKGAGSLRESKDQSAV